MHWVLQTGEGRGRARTPLVICETTSVPNGKNTSELQQATTATISSLCSQNTFLCSATVFKCFTEELISIREDSRPVCARILVPLEDEDVRSLPAAARRLFVPRRDES